MRLISWRHALFLCVWYGLHSSKSEPEQWVWCVNIETGSYSNADHTRRIRKGRDVTKSDACAQKTHRTHAVCINFSLPRGVQRVYFYHVWWRTYCPLIYGYYTPKQIISTLLSKEPPTATAMRKCPAFKGGPQQPLSCVKYSLLLMKGPPTATAMCK